MIQEQISMVKVKNGEDGENGLTSYTHVAWANSSDGREDFSLTESLGKKYEGTYTDFTEGASTDPSKYKWIESANVFRDEVEAAKQAGYEAKDKSYEAKIESSKAIESASSAVNTANSASDDASFAKNTADEAKSESSKAIESASSAVNTASSASDDANFAKNTANEAKGIANEAKSNASQAIDNAKSSLEKSNSNERTIVDVSESVDTVKGELSSKVNQTDYDALKGTVSDQETSIEQNAIDIKSKASSADVDTINETVENQETSIEQNAKAIKTKAEQSDVDNVSGEVETLSTTVSQEAGKLSTVSSKVSDNESLIGHLESSYDGLSSTVAKVRNDFDELDYSDRNLLPGTSDEWETYEWDSSYGVQGGEYSLGELGLKVGDTITFSKMLDNTLDDVDSSIWAQIKFRDANGETLSSMQTSSVESGQRGYVKATKKIPEKTHNLYIFKVSKGDNQTAKTVAGKETKLQRGTRATLWTPAPEDMATVEQFSSLEQNLNGFKTTVQNEKANSADVDAISETVESHGTEISQNAKDIKLKASSADVDTINETVKSHGTEISQNVEAIKTKAEQNYVDDVKGTVESISTTVEQQAGSIKAINSKTDGNATKIGSLESSYDGLSSTVTEVSEDLNDSVIKLSSLEQNLNGFKTTVQNEKADKTTVTQLADQWQQTTDLVDGHTSQISSLGSDLNLRVAKDDVINQINISDESILIDSAKTHITGKTTIEEGVIDTAYIKDAAITSAKIKDITADKIKAGEVSGLILTSLSETGKFSVEGQHASLENTDTGWKTDIYDDGIYTYNSDHSLRARFTEDIINSNKFGTSSTNVYLATGGLDGVAGESAGGEVRAVLYTQHIEDGEDVGSKYEYTYRPFRGEGMVGSYVNLNTAIPGSNNMYLRVPSGKEVKITRIGTVDDFQDIRAQHGYFASIVQEQVDGGNFYIGSNGETRFTSRGGYNGDATIYRDIRAQDARIAAILQKDGGTNFYLGTGGNLRVTSRTGYNDGDTKYKAVEASGFSNKSLAALKTDIFKHQDDALSCINAADIYNYKLKEEVAEAHPSNHIGLVIGDGYNTPDCVKNNDGTAIDIYAMSSVAWKAIQELSNKNEVLNNRISNLQSEIDILRKETSK